MYHIAMKNKFTSKFEFSPDSQEKLSTQELRICGEVRQFQNDLEAEMR